MGSDNDHKLYAQVTAGGISGETAVDIISSLDVVKTRLQTESVTTAMLYSSYKMVPSL